MVKFSSGPPTSDLDMEQWEHFKGVVSTLLDEEPASWPTLLVEQCGHDLNLFLDTACFVRLSFHLGTFLEEPALVRALS